MMVRAGACPFFVAAGRYAPIGTELVEYVPSKNEAELNCEQLNIRATAICAKTVTQAAIGIILRSLASH